MVTGSTTGMPGTGHAPAALAANPRAKLGERVLHSLRRDGPQSAGEVAAALGAAPTAVVSALRRLVARGRVHRAHGAGGRPLRGSDGTDYVWRLRDSAAGGPQGHTSVGGRR